MNAAQQLDKVLQRLFEWLFALFQLRITELP